MTDDPNLDPFWVEQRTRFLAERSTCAEPDACGTCRSNVEVGAPVEHDECQRRATLMLAPDHPDYELLAGFSLEENAKLPPRFHVPVFDDCGKPNAWLCAVCWEDGVSSQWPCATAQKYGTQVFTPQHAAETAQKKQTAELEKVSAEIARFGIYGAAVPAAKALVQRADELVTDNAKLRARVAELEKDSATLAALEAAGVDNWEGYSDALAGVDE